ncbi:hypothetical protein [Thermocrinis sp.]|jgi:hypothetical protein|uniref:hypothetical protein n=1 Tax=Thermocrinis sp. TaxID=2024383 RepID=UPI003C0D1F1D
MREVDFLGLWEREIWKKRIAIAFAVLFFLMFLFTLLTSGERKTDRERVLEYVVCRLNYTSFDVDRAYLNCPYQYKGLGYDSATQAERNEIKRSGLASFFHPMSVEYDLTGRRWVVSGRRLVVDGSGQMEVREVKAIVVKNSGGFLLEKVE